MTCGSVWVAGQAVLLAPIPSCSPARLPLRSHERGHGRLAGDGAQRACARCGYRFGRKMRRGKVRSRDHPHIEDHDLPFIIADVVPIARLRAFLYTYTTIQYTPRSMDLHFLDPVPPYTIQDLSLANAQPPPAYEHPPPYQGVVSHVVQLGDPVGMLESHLIQDNDIVYPHVEQQADTGAFGPIRKAYARAKKWVARRFRR